MRQKMIFATAIKLSWLELGVQMALPQDNVLGGGSWVKKKLVGRKILSVVKLVGEKWCVVVSAVPFCPIPTRALEMWLWSPEVSFKNKVFQKICFSKEFPIFLHFYTVNSLCASI